MEISEKDRAELIAIYAKQRELADEQHALARRIAELSRRINPSKQDEDYS